jgi:DNA-binding NarL/FixJ family response regulator
MHGPISLSRTLGTVRVLDCGCAPSETDAVLCGLRGAGWRIALDRVDRASAAIRKLRGRIFDLVLLDWASLGMRTCRVARAVRIASPGARIIVTSAPEDVAAIAQLVRAGVHDLIPAGSDWSAPDVVGCVRDLAAHAVASRLAHERMTVLESACRRLSRERAELEAQVLQMASGLAAAEQDACEREERAALSSEFRTLVAQETDIDSVISLGGHYLVARMGATNAALFVLDSERWRLGGYVRDDLARRAAGGLLDHIADTWCSRLAAQSGCVRISPAEAAPGGWAALSGLLPGRHVLAFACYGQEGSLVAHPVAAVVLFRDASRPFGPECVRAADALAPAFGASIDRVRRVLSRARPSWPAEPPGEARGSE